MDTLFGSTKNLNVKSDPTVGTGTQANFFQSLFNTGLQQKDDGSFAFRPLSGYQGQLTPDLSQMMASNVWGSWNPQAQGASQLQQQLGAIQQAQGPQRPAMPPAMMPGNAYGVQPGPSQWGMQAQGPQQQFSPMMNQLMMPQQQRRW